MITQKEIYESLVDVLSSIDFFKYYKWNKGWKMLIEKSENTVKSIEFRLFQSVSDERDDIFSFALTVTITIRFKILHEWFEEFYQGSSIRDYKKKSIKFKNVFTHGDGGYLYFHSDGKNLKSTLLKAKNRIFDESTSFFESFKSLEDTYNNLIEPILERPEILKKKLNSGTPWIFEYLALTKIVEPSEYEALKKILGKHLKELYEDEEINALDYYPIYNKAIEKLESITFS